MEVLVKKTLAALRQTGLKRVVVHGNGTEYRRAAQLKAMQLPVLLPEDVRFEGVKK